MALDVAVGTFTITSGLGTQSVTISPAFQPKVVIAYWTRATADATYTAHGGFGFGVAVDRATDQQANVTFYNVDNVATTDSATAKSTTTFIRNQGSVGPGFDVIASISSFDATGFTINKTTNSEGSLNIIKYVCLGGSDITDAYLAEFPITTGNGTKTLTGAPFQPEFAMFFGWPSTASGGDSRVDHQFFLGATNGTQEGSVAAYGDDGTTSANRQESYINSSNVLAIPDGGTPGIYTLGSFGSWTSDGMTVSVSANSAGATLYPLVLLLDGTFQSHVGTQARPTSNGTQDVTSVGFQPSLVMLGGTYATASATETTQAHLSLGAATSSTTDHGIWVGDAASINTDTNMYSSASNIYTQATNPSTTAAQAGLDSMLSNGYRLDWGTTDGNARLFMHIALASASSPPGTGALSATGTQSILNRGIYTRSMIQGT